MKKNDAPAATKAAPKKSAAAVARREANIALAKERLILLQQKQRIAAMMRSKGHLGSDETLVALYEKDRDAAERQKEERRSVEFVDRLLASPYGEKAMQFVGPNGMAGHPTKVAFVLRNWLRTQGKTAEVWVA